MTTVAALIAKSPEPGAVKTRLCPPLSEAQAGAVAAAMLADTLANAVAAGLDVRCVHSGPSGPVADVVGDAPLIRQRGEGLAARLAHAQDDLFASGAARLLLVAGDAPTLDPGLLRRAAAALERAEVVVGPARDGGYTILGSRAPTPELLDGVTMGTARVLAQTLERAHRAGRRVAVLEPRHDLDTLADLRAAEAAGELACAPRTRTALREFLGAFDDAAEEVRP